MDDDTPAFEQCQVLDIGCHLSSLFSYFADFFNWIYSKILDGAAYALSAIPVPDWLDAPSFSLPDGVLWFANVLQLQEGVAIMTSAWVARFIIRRLPVIG